MGGRDALEQAVDGVGEILQLVARTLEGEALVQVGRGDLVLSGRQAEEARQCGGIASSSAVYIAM